MCLFAFRHKIVSSLYLYYVRLSKSDISYINKSSLSLTNPRIILKFARQIKTLFYLQFITDNNKVLMVTDTHSRPVYIDYTNSAVEYYIELHIYKHKLRLQH